MKFTDVGAITAFFLFGKQAVRTEEVMDLFDAVIDFPVIDGEIQGLVLVFEKHGNVLAT